MSGLIRYLLENFQYYDKPDGTDPVNKLVGTAKYGLLTGCCVGLYDAVLISKCETFWQTANTFGYWVCPLVAMGLAFSSVTYISTQIRNKDDRLNHCFGALAAGSIFKAWQGCNVKTGWFTLCIVLYAVLKKDAVMTGKHSNGFILPEKLPATWNVPWRRMDNRDWQLASQHRHEKDYYSW